MPEFCDHYRCILSPNAPPSRASSVLSECDDPWTRRNGSQSPFKFEDHCKEVSLWYFTVSTFPRSLMALSIWNDRPLGQLVGDILNLSPNAEMNENLAFRDQPSIGNSNNFAFNGCCKVQTRRFFMQIVAISP